MSSNVKVLLATLLLSVFVSLSPAAPYINQPYDFYQPDGSKLTVILNGDEFYMRAATTDGYTVVRDSATGWICYGQLSADGSKLVSTGVAVGQETATKDKDSSGSKSITPTIKVQKELKINLDAQKQIVIERKNLLLGEGKSYVGQSDYPTDSKAYSIEGIESSAPDVLPGTKNVNEFIGTIRGLVLIFDFSDEPAPYSLTQYEEKVNKPDYHSSNGNARSLRTYYEDVSNGVFIMNHYVYGIYRAPKTFAEYDAMGYAQGAQELLGIGLNQMEADGFDFSQLSTNSNGTIKAIALMYTGNPAAWAEGMWFHASGYDKFSADGVRSGSYCTDTARDLGPGTLIHEHGHMVAKWPDTYSYVGGEPGTWGVMGGGYCDLPNPYFMYENGWLAAENINGTPSNYTMNSADPYFAYFYYAPDQPSEFYMLRPYTKSLLYCPSIPEEGMTIWRINTNGDNANYPDRDRHIELVHPNNDDRTKNNGVVFKQGGLLDEFTSATVPSSDWKFGTKSGQPSGMEVTEISLPGSQMTFTLGTPPTPVPYYEMNGNLNDSSGNGLKATGYNFTSGAISSDVYKGVKYDLGQCVLFDGVDDYITCPAEVTTGGELSVSFWAKPTNEGDMTVLDKFPADDSGAGWSIGFNNNGRLVFKIGSSSNYTEAVTPYQVYEYNKWVNITCTFGEGTAIIYIDGQLRMIKSGIIQTPANTTTELRMAIAAEVDSQQKYAGYLDDIRFYDQILQPTHFRNVESMTFKPKKGITTYLKLDEKSGTEAADSSGNGKTGSLVNGLSFEDNSVAGKVGSALVFDGTDDYISLPSEEPLAINDGFTIALWAYPTSVANWSRYIDFGNGSGIDNIILGRQGNTNDLFFEIYMDGGAPKVTAAGAIQLNVWQFFAATVDSSGNVRLYKNGQQIQTGTTNPATELYRKNLYIGRSNWSSDSYFKGMMDDIRIYNYNLSTSELAAVYNSNTHGNPVPANGRSVSPQVILDFEPAANATAHDIYFSTRYNEILNADRNSPVYIGRKYSTRYNPPLLDAWRRYFWRVDEVLANGSIVTGQVWEFDTTGSLQRDVWTGLSGDDTVSSLTSSADYPDAPTLTTELTTFEIPSNYADSYGTRVHGMVVPQTSGNYQFWISGDNEVELWLSSDSDPANAAMIAYIHNNWSSQRDFDQVSTQKSRLIQLTAGQPYYIMALHKEGNGGDHMAVAWKGPDNPTRSIMDRFWMRPPYENEWPIIETYNNTALNAAEGLAVDTNLPYTTIDADDDNVTISKIGGPNWLLAGPDGRLTGTPKDANVGSNSFIIQAADGKGGFDTAMFNINVANRYSGDNGLADLDGFLNEWLTDGNGNPADLTDDSFVDTVDFGKLAENWLVSYDDGLIGNWKLDENSGIAARDSYNDYDGTLINVSRDNWVAGVSGNALLLDGAEDYVQVNGFTGISGSSARTVTAFIKASEDQANAEKKIHTIVSWGQAQAKKKWVLMLDSNTGQPALATYGGKLIGGPDLEDGQWHHVAVVLPAGQDNISEVKLYVDGEEIATNSEILDSEINTTVNENVIIGALDTDPADGVQNPGHFFNGILDEVRVYSRGLSASEIAELANTGN